MNKGFSVRYASMTDEQLEYEASRSNEFSVDARKAMRCEFDKRGLDYDEKLSIHYDIIMDDYRQNPHRHDGVWRFIKKHPFISCVVFSMIVRVAYKVLYPYFG